MNDLERRLADLSDDEWAPEPAPRLVPDPRRGRVGARWDVSRPAIALTCLAIGATGGVLMSGESADAPDAGGRTVVLRALGPPGPGATAFVRDGQQVTLDAHGLRALPPGQFYELWALRTPTELVSLGTFRAADDGRVTVTLPAPIDPDAFPVLDISVERADGNPAHSGNSVLRS